MASMLPALSFRGWSPYQDIGLATGDLNWMVPQFKGSACQYRKRKRHGSEPWVEKIPWNRKWQFTLVFLPRKFHRQRSLVGYSPQGCKELERLSTHTWASLFVVQLHICIQFSQATLQGEVTTVLRKRSGFFPADPAPCQIFVTCFAGCVCVSAQCVWCYMQVFGDLVPQGTSLWESLNRPFCPPPGISLLILNSVFETAS